MRSSKQLIAAGVEKDDIVVDCGNSLWTDTIRREKEYADQLQVLRLGRLRRRGGRALRALAHARRRSGLVEAPKPIWEAVAAKVDAKTGKPLEDCAPGKPVTGGVPCTAYIGPNGAGHYVKMVHNGIEYIDMQLICEAYYAAARTCSGMTPDELAQGLRRVERGRPRLVPDPDHRRHPPAARPAHDRRASSSITSSTPPARRAPASGRASTRSTWASPPTRSPRRCSRAASRALKDERVAASKVLKGPPAAVPRRPRPS